MFVMLMIRFVQMTKCIDAYENDLIEDQIHIFLREEFIIYTLLLVAGATTILLEKVNNISNITW